VLKFLMERNSTNALHGQVTIGTLILQDCAVGLLFALLPVLGGTSGVLQGVMSMAKSLIVLCSFLAILSILSRTCVPWFLKLMISLSSQTNELYQLASVAFCLLVAWCSDKLGLSLELGSFAAGVMISTTDLSQHTLEQFAISSLNSTLVLAVPFLNLKLLCLSHNLSREIPATGLVLNIDALANLSVNGSNWRIYYRQGKVGDDVPASAGRRVMPCGRKEFEGYLDVVGCLRHPNLVHLHAYYYAKQEKLLVYDYLHPLLPPPRIGMLIHVHFLWNHVDILLAAVILVVTVKTLVITTVVKGFGYTNKTSLLVGMSLAQIGEFAFVLLSRASNLHLVEGKLYLLLLGTTALSLALFCRVAATSDQREMAPWSPMRRESNAAAKEGKGPRVTTPLLFKLIPAVIHLGILLRWFAPDCGQNEMGFKGDSLRADSAKRITLMRSVDHLKASSRPKFTGREIGAKQEKP
ncbi:hypothetical protein Taro_025344, partial [Colocasia esculenta]|nr:hypothetical protein [Colocasia esculenta]